MFDDFKRGPAAGACAKLGLRVAGLHNWSEFTAAFGALDDKMDGKLPAKLRKLPGGTADAAIFQAILHAADHSHVADDWEGSGTWTRLQYVTGDYAEAVAAAILRRS